MLADNPRKHQKPHRSRGIPRFLGKFTDFGSVFSAVSVAEASPATEPPGTQKQ
jgi:hypothetical protein